MEYNLLLPDDITIYNILTRVPTQSLIRFRCVCKQWSNLIFDHAFVDLHTRNLSCNPTPGLIFHSNDDQDHIFRLIFFDVDKKEEKKMGFRKQNDIGLGNNITIFASVNGLLLISTKDVITKKLNYHVYNPSTGCSMILRRPLNLVSKYKGLGLAYDSIIKKYKVAYYGYNSRRKDYGYFCKIITLGVEGDSWRDVVVPEPHRVSYCPPVFANGCLHWPIGCDNYGSLERSHYIKPESRGKILTLDVTREIFYTIEHPKCDFGEYTLMDMRGLLCFVDHVLRTGLKLWVLKDLERHEWMEVHNIDMGSELERMPFISSESGSSYPFAILPNPNNTHNKRMIITCHNISSNMRKLYSYDMELKQLDEIGVSGLVLWYSSERKAWFSPICHVNTLAYF